MSFCHILFILCALIYNVLGNTEKIIFASDTNDCIPYTTPIDFGQPLIHPYTSLRTSLLSPSVNLFPLHNLTFGSKYEVRLSYPATVPTDFEFSLVCQDGEGLFGVVIKGVYAGVSLKKGVENTPVPVNIVLEELALGVVYHGIYKVIIMIIIVLLLGYFMIIPRIKHFLLQPIKED
ncbi:hypothetical protein BC941DRAFT_427304 [Chlamydoabsidia padenii]|nr:hypothetical protein BC941DRAFT_427304 [Chlamydoabsidia padenii]